MQGQNAFLWAHAARSGLSEETRRLSETNFLHTQEQSARSQADERSESHTHKGVAAGDFEVLGHLVQHACACLEVDLVHF